jgi:hypothetical protein
VQNLAFRLKDKAATASKPVNMLPQATDGGV